MSKFRYYITSEDYSVLGTNDEGLAEKYKETDCCSVIDTHESGLSFIAAPTLPTEICDVNR